MPVPSTTEATGGKTLSAVSYLIQFQTSCHLRIFRIWFFIHKCANPVSTLDRNSPTRFHATKPNWVVKINALIFPTACSLARHRWNRKRESSVNEIKLYLWDFRKILPLPFLPRHSIFVSLAGTKRSFYSAIQFNYRRRCAHKTPRRCLPLGR